MTDEMQLRTLLHELELEPPRPFTGADILALADTGQAPRVAAARRWLLPLAAAAAVALLAGVTVALASSRGGSHRSLPATSTAATSATACTAGEVTASYTPPVRDPATKRTGPATPADTALLVTLTNHSSATCTIRGYVGNPPATKPGAQVPVTIHHGVDGYPDPGQQTVSLDPGGRASFVLEILTAGSTTARLVTSFDEFTVPGDRTPIVVPQRYRIEAGLQAGQRMTVGVTAVAAGSSWPAR